jgi:outer membrane murein-binding lipoprotein Lpp
MAGPRIYTDAWERLKVAAKELEEKEAENLGEEEEPRTVHSAPDKPKARQRLRIFVVATVVMAVLIVLVGSLWIDSQARLMNHAREVAELKTRIDLLQEKVRKAEEEKKRLEDENGTLSMHYEQKAAELADLEQELETLRTQKEKTVAKPKRPQAKIENPPVAVPAPPRVSQEHPPVNPPQEKTRAAKPESREQQGIKVYTID